MRKTYVHLFLFVIAANILVSGGRLAVSDELAIFLTTESLVKQGNLAISNDLVKNGSVGNGGKFYAGSGIAQSILNIPLYVAGDAVTEILGLSEPLKTLTVRAVSSLFNQLFAGLIAVVMFAFGIRLGYSRRISLFLTLSLLFTTNLFPYSKSFMREPQLLFYLLAAVFFLYCFKLDGKPKYLVYSGILGAVGLLTRLTAVVALPVLFAYLIAVLVETRQPGTPVWPRLFRSSILFGMPVLAGIALNALYNYVQFGDMNATPYAKLGFSTPLFVGIYGLVFSSGKSLFLYAPLAVLVFPALSRFRETNRLEMYLFAGLFLANLVFFAKFMAWAGDGSWGPRYLISTLPFFVLPVGRLLQTRTAAKNIALGLAALGFLIQVGGVSIYLGNYLRQIGEFPLTRNFDDPEFFYKSHFIPNYSPVIGHWEMLVRNVQVNFSAEKPDFRITNTGERIPLSESDKASLLYTLDFWCMYLSYAGVGSGPILAAVFSLVLVTFWLGFRTYRTAGAGPPPIHGGSTPQQEKVVS